MAKIIMPQESEVITAARKSLFDSMSNVPAGIDNKFALVKKHDLLMILMWLDTLDSLKKK